MLRRTAVSAALLALLGSLTAAGAVATADPHGGGVTGRFDRPQVGFAPPRTVLRNGPPQSVGLDPAPIETALTRIDGWTRPDPATGHPLFAGAVALLAHDGVVAKRATAGYALRYADAAGTELPDADKVPMRTDTIFDMASVSKLFTSIAVMQLVESGQVDVH